MGRVVDQCCDEFETAWQKGKPISIESLLGRSDTENRAGLLRELIQLEIRLRRDAGENPSAAEYHARFPHQQSAIESAIDTVLVLHPKVDAAAESLLTQKASTEFFAGKRMSRASAFSDGSSRKSVGRYTIVDSLGQGGQADVFRGIHPTLPIEVAIKLTHTTLADSARDLLEAEAHILCDLDHPNIARIRDFDFDGGRPFMVLDFIRGRSLAQVAASQPMSPEAIAALVAKLARAIEYAHARGVLHRDLKPDNVVIDESGEPKIIDFGMSRLRSGIAGQVNEADEVSGTLAYMAPEQAAGVMSQTDHRIDVFALGAILYRLLVGRAPYPNLNFRDLIQRVRNGDYETKALDAADAPESLKKVIRQALQFDPAARHASAHELAEALNQVVAIERKSGSWKIRTIAVSCSIGALLLLAASFVFVRRPAGTIDLSAPGSSPQIRSADELIREFHITHIGNSTELAEFSGPLLRGFRPPRLNDDIQIRAEFTQPVYCFLVALNPDGVKQLCYPAVGDTLQTEPIRSLRFPQAENAAFGLTDGVGQQAFVLFTSREPLPAYNDWQSQLASAVWPDPGVVGNWGYAGGELSALSRSDSVNRGDVRPLKTPMPFKQLCDQLRAQETTDVRGVIFEVQP